MQSFKTSCKQLVKSFSGLKYCGENDNYTTELSIRDLLIIPSNRTGKYSKQATKYSCIIDWNKFKKDFCDVNQNELSHFKLKILLKDCISQY